MVTRPGLYANIRARQRKVAKGVKDPKTGKKITMRKKGQKGAPTDKAFRQAAKTAKKKRT